MESSTRTMTHITSDWFASFVEVYRVDAIRLAWRLLGNERAMAEDIVQQAFVRAWHKRADYRGHANPKTWMYRIIVNQVRSYQRWRSVRVKAFRWLVPIKRDDNIAQVHPDHGLRERLMQAVDQLSRGQKEAFILVYIDGFTMREAAEVLGRSEGTIKSHVHRSIQRLRDDLSDLWE